MLTQVPVLVALRAIKNGGLASENLPTRIKLLNWGRNESTKGAVIVDETSVASLNANQKTLGFDRVALDYEHNTVPGTDEFKRTKEPRDVAAYGVPEIVSGDGLYLGALEWTPSGKASAKNYVDLSPAVSMDEQGRVTFMHSTALTRNGSVFDLHFFSANQNQNIMNETQVKALVITTFAALLGMPAASTEAEVQAKLKTFSTPQVPDIKTLSVESGDKRFSLGDLAGKIITLETQFAAGATAATDAERGELILKFSADGKVPVKADGKAYSAEEMKALSVDTLKLLHANTPVTVPLSVRGKTTSDKGGGDDTLKGADRAAAAWGHLEK